jgi:cell division protease FtsH
MNLVNEAALLAARRNKRLVTHGRVRGCQGQGDDGGRAPLHGHDRGRKALTAYHEAGHAIVALNVPAADPVHKATIIPRGRALGMVMQLPEGDRYSMSYKQMTSRLAIMMGGRVAEETDLRQGEHHLRRTVRHRSGHQAGPRDGHPVGLSEELGQVSYGDNQEEVFLGHSVAQQKNISEETAQKIDSEIKRLVDEAYQTSGRAFMEVRLFSF